MSLRSLLAILGLASALAATSGCDPGANTPCEPACDDGFVCDTDDGSCTTPRMPLYEGDAPGRSVRMVVDRDEIFLSALHPRSGQIVVGADGVDEPALFVVDQVSRPLGKKLALAKSGSYVVVAWLGTDARYRVAVHDRDLGPDRWRVLPGARVPDEEYDPTEHFDVAVDEAGALQLVFHDQATGTLRYLSRPLGEGRWQLGTVDDPSTTDDESVCSEQQRRLSGRGVGQYPDLLVGPAGTFVAYHDADCGDLRLARQLDGQWAVSVVDPGNFDRADGGPAGGAVTGRFASMAIDSSGSLAIAYQDVTRGQLIFAYSREGRFVIEVADPGFEVDESSRRQKHIVGGFASLVFDENDVPWIAYIDSTTARLRLAHRSRDVSQTGIWLQQTVDARPPTGFSAALGFSAELGRVVAAEHLRPRPDGLETHLQLLGEGEF